MVHALQGFNQAFLIHGACTRNNFQSLDAFAQFLIGKCSKFRTGNDVAVSICSVPQTDLSTDFLGRTRRIARHDLNLNTRVDTFLHSLRHTGTHGVGNGHHAHEVEFVGHHFAALDGCIAFLQNLVSETKGTHSAVLISEELAVNFLARYAAVEGGTERVHNFGSTLHIHHALTGHNS